MPDDAQRTSDGLELGPSTPCDRCGHPLRRHGAPPIPSRCLVGARIQDPKDPRRCPCDGFFYVNREPAEATA